MGGACTISPPLLIPRSSPLDTWVFLVFRNVVSLLLSLSLETLCLLETHLFLLSFFLDFLGVSCLCFRNVLLLSFLCKGTYGRKVM